MINIGVVNIDISHPKTFSEYLLTSIVTYLSLYQTK